MIPQFTAVSKFKLDLPAHPRRTKKYTVLDISHGSSARRYCRQDRRIVRGLRANMHRELRVAECGASRGVGLDEVVSRSRSFSPPVATFSPLVRAQGVGGEIPGEQGGPASVLSRLWASEPSLDVLRCLSRSALSVGPNSSRHASHWTANAAHNRGLLQLIHKPADTFRFTSSNRACFPAGSLRKSDNISGLVYQYGTVVGWPIARHSRFDQIRSNYVESSRRREPAGVSAVNSPADTPSRVDQLLNYIYLYIYII